MATAMGWASLYPCIRELVQLPCLGHCPQDEAPDHVQQPRRTSAQICSSGNMQQQPSVLKQICTIADESRSSAQDN